MTRKVPVIDLNMTTDKCFLAIKVAFLKCFRHIICPKLIGPQAYIEQFGKTDDDTLRHR